MYFEGQFKQYMDDLASYKPAPGGGSAAAAAGALGVSLLSMVANFTVGKEKYKDVEAEIQEVLSSSEKLRTELQKLIDDDVVAYKGVSAAYKMPKESDKEKTARSEAIQAALKQAMSVPLAICRNLYEAISLCEPLLEKGNVNLVSDVGVAAELIAGGFASAVLNVEINLAGIEDPDMASKIRDELSSREKQIQIIREKVVRQTKEKIK
jgi:formiminotetrahydrofolate cyclodeaminase